MTSDASWLNGRRVFAISIGHDMLAGVANGMGDAGAEVVRIGADINLSSRKTVAAGIAAAIAKHGAPELVAISVIPLQAMRVETVAAMAEADWRDAAMDGLRTTTRLLQALGPHLKPRGGAIVFVAPSLSLVGAPGMVALSTLLEGQRGLMKAVARQWGGSGVTLNWVSAAPRALAPFEDVALAAKPDAVSVALGRAPDPRAEIAPILGFLASEAGRSITGATLMVDGGEWMVP
ncbi:SDR family oxidoreductase [Terricaulis silvestris]|uniref:3-oxoacyl-[acyl-carrier-protein] reductase FabG n=1 Tax=Terricaulis silvestris TaxID=2686094 RepID=A0A6I6MRZ5_9CAUL|nr:SDR family oxidoreductase [Terricaulis silvestris]QGZ96158.1 3-oxoacyl-[acyl-carrier-protein] reductase FabG [Terricaulis silvestris]